MKTTYAAFDAADYLDNDEVIAEYLSAAAEDANPEVFLTALDDVAKARSSPLLRPTKLE
jgi:probable addiction module antidote protein